MQADEKKVQEVQFLRNAVAYYARLGITIKRLLTDNGAAFHSREFALARSFSDPAQVHAGLPAPHQWKG